jgi:hypothetical protein
MLVPKSARDRVRIAIIFAISSLGGPAFDDLGPELAAPRNT